MESRYSPHGRFLAWKFHPRLHLVRSDRIERFVETLPVALAAGHGLGGELRLTYRSGPRGGIEVEVSEGALGRWWTGSITALFAPGQWASLRPLPGPIDGGWVGRPLRRFPLPLWRAPPTQIAQRIGGVLGALPGGLSLTWKLRASRPVTEPALGETHPAPVPLGAGSGRAAPPRGPPHRAPPYDRADLLAHRIWACRVTLSRRFPAQGPMTEERLAVERALFGPEGNGLRFARPHRWAWGAFGEFPLRGTELASLLPSPRGEGWPIILEGAEDPGESLWVGDDAQGRPWRLGLLPGEGRHLAVLGETGMGKSSFLATLAQAAARRHGVTLFDPMGETARHLLAILDTESLGRTVWLSPVDSPRGLNALAGSAPEEDRSRSARRVVNLVEALRRVRAGHYVERSFWGPRIEEMLGRALHAAASVRGTMVEAHRFLERATEGSRSAPSDPPEVRALFDRVRQRPEDAEGAKRLLFEYTSSPDLVRMLCEPTPELRAQDLVAPGVIAVLSGEASRVGEATARRLLAAWFALVWSELMAREHAAKTFVVLDEVQWFGDQVLGEMLRLARRYNVHVVVGTQSLHGLPLDTAEAIRTNVADYLLFRGSPDEGREFARNIPGLTAEDMLSLGKGEAVFLGEKGRQVRFVRVHHRPARTDQRSLPRDRPIPRGAERPSRSRFVTAPPPFSDGPTDDGAPRRPFDETRRVYLHELGAATPSLRPTLREWGGTLGRRQWLRGRGTDGRGPYWELTAEGYDWLFAQLAPNEEGERDPDRYRGTPS